MLKKVEAFLKVGHFPTLFSAFLYFDFCFAVWVLNGAMAPFITEHFQLSPAETGFMLSIPIFAGALMRFPLGVLSQYIGRKNSALLEMSILVVACLFAQFLVTTYDGLLWMGGLLGIAGASFGIALSLGSGWYPKSYKGLAMGLTGAGNSGTAVAALAAPPLAMIYGWQNVYGFAAVMMMLPILVMIFWAKEPPDRARQSAKDHVKCLWEADGWVFNLIYVVTFGGFIGLASFLPTFFYEQFQVTKVQAGQLTVVAAIVGSAMRVVGGYLADRVGGLVALRFILIAAVLFLSVLSTQPSLLTTTILLMCCFGVLGAGNGAVFQLVPLRWPATTAVAGSMIGEIGALGGSLIPNLMGQSKQWTGSYSIGFLSFGLLAVAVTLMLTYAQRAWTGVWIGKGGLVLEQFSRSDLSGKTSNG
jgi:NNP family nitrate/nitrite transporter-like MFS transporter